MPWGRAGSRVTWKLLPWPALSSRELSSIIMYQGWVMWILLAGCGRHREGPTCLLSCHVLGLAGVPSSGVPGEGELNGWQGWK